MQTNPASVLRIPVREHIALTPFEPGDLPALPRYLNHPVVFQNTLNIPSPYTEADAQFWLDKVAALEQEHGMRPNWAIRHDTQGLIGGIGCFLRNGTEGHSDEIGYWLAEPYWGQGIMTDAVQVFCVWLFALRPVLVRVEAIVFSYNPASVRVLEKAGFRQEGFLRKARKKQDTLIDVYLMARLREDVQGSTGFVSAAIQSS
jgi:RimJ/RimL family protein N-acetyltransferase